MCASTSLISAQNASSGATVAPKPRHFDHVLIVVLENQNYESAIKNDLLKSLIQKGTPGDVVGTNSLFQVSSIPRSQVKVGAFVDPKTLTGKVAATDVYPGQQLTAEDFVVGNANALTQRLARDQRGVVVPLDSFP